MDGERGFVRKKEFLTGCDLDARHECDVPCGGAAGCRDAGGGVVIRDGDLDKSACATSCSGVIVPSEQLV